MASTLAMSAFVVSLMVVGFVLVSVVLILVVLIQRPQGGGLSGAFGAGAGSGQTAFGAKTGDALTLATVFMFVLFLVVAVALNFMTRPTEGDPLNPAITSTTLPSEGEPVEGADTATEEGVGVDSDAAEGGVEPVIDDPTAGPATEGEAGDAGAPTPDTPSDEPVSDPGEGG